MKNLLGLWMIDPDTRPEQIVTMEFKEDGQLIYTVIGEESDGIILLTYRIEGNIIISDQPSEPREERTKFSITTEGKLILIYDNQISQFIRIPPMISSMN